MRVAHLILEADFRMWHTGLELLARKTLKMSLDELAPGAGIFFFNKKLDKCKVLTANGVMSYAKFDGPISAAKLNVFTDAVSPGMKLTVSREMAHAIAEALGAESPRPEASVRRRISVPTEARV